jgi:hypothetical protein
MSEVPDVLPDDAPVHRVGGGHVVNLWPRPAELTLNPPGISVFWGGTPEEAAEAMRKQFPRMAPRGTTVVGTATAGTIRLAGFDVLKDRSRRFPYHARLIHPAGAEGFTQENLERLAQCFENHSGL